jgi:pSer/pThr/pTyr-binding forkhead associated (FHA) protein
MFRLKMHLHGAQVKELELEDGREYTFGRGSNCDVQLEDISGISRSHFRIIERDGQWIAEVISKFGDIKQAGQSVQAVQLSPGSVFALSAYEFRFMEPARHELSIASGGEEMSPQTSAAPSRTSMSPQNTLVPVASHRAPAPMPEPEPDFEGNDEATRIISTSTLSGVPFLRIVEKDGGEETRRLEGRRWVAGREEGCEILLNDRKSSRKQFELIGSPDGFAIRDLGSSNGTLLNGNTLEANEPRSIRSGDVIQVGALVLHFEVRDPNYEKKLMVISPQVMAMPAVESQYEMINYPVVSGPGGAVRVDQAIGPWTGGANPYGQPHGEDLEAKKKKKMRFILIAAAVLLPIVALIAGQDETPKKQSKKVESSINESFSRLSPKNQQFVKEYYTNAKNLFMQGKQALAYDWLRKLHEILPEGYENSIAIAHECEEQAKQAEALTGLQNDQKRQAENALKVERNLRECERVASNAASIDELKNCLAPSFELDPSNPKIADYLTRVQARIDAKNLKNTQQRDYAGRVSRGRGLFASAEKLDKKGDFYGAIDAYKKYIDSGLPDPDNLRSRSQRNIANITKGISTKSEQNIQQAEAAYASQNLKEALDLLKKARELDPKNDKVSELISKYRHELNVKLREVYEGAVIDEGLGNIEEAKVKWKKILELDTADGDYSRKSKSKMRLYGVG